MIFAYVHERNKRREKSMLRPRCSRVEVTLGGVGMEALRGTAGSTDDGARHVDSRHHAFAESLADDGRGRRNCSVAERNPVTSNILLEVRPHIPTFALTVRNLGKRVALLQRIIANISDGREQ